jgi:hypothetical protein
LEIIPAVVTSTNIPVSFHDDVEEEEPDFGHLPDTQNLVGCLLDAAAASAKYDDEEKDGILDYEVHVDEMYFTNARKWQEKSMAPIVDLTLLCESDF